MARSSKQASLIFGNSYMKNSSSSAIERPLVTFAIIAYNQEHYIRHAVEGAFAQTYSPLEIILSDDDSTDGTYKVMCEMVASYTGEHKIILNRNTTNQGIGSHVNQIMNRSSGEWIVIGAGDDVSEPERTTKIVNRWLEAPERIKLVYSDYWTIRDGSDAKELTRTGKPVEWYAPNHLCKDHFSGVTGASSSWSRDLFTFFGPLLPTVTFEDRALSFRAALLGEVVHIPEPLVNYRRHEENTVQMFHQNSANASLKMIRCHLRVYENSLLDLQHFATSRPSAASSLKACRSVILKSRSKLAAYEKILSARLFGKMRGFVQLCACGGNPLAGLRWFVRSLSTKP